MKRTLCFVRCEGSVVCRLDDGEEVRIPVVPGILKHPTLDSLRAMLGNPHVAKKYTIAALRRAPWPVLRQFERDWLLRCLADGELAPGRLRALEFLLR